MDKKIGLGRLLEAACFYNMHVTNTIHLRKLGCRISSFSERLPRYWWSCFFAQNCCWGVGKSIIHCLWDGGKWTLGICILSNWGACVFLRRRLRVTGLKQLFGLRVVTLKEEGKGEIPAKSGAKYSCSYFGRRTKWPENAVSCVGRRWEEGAARRKSPQFFFFRPPDLRLEVARPIHPPQPPLPVPRQIWICSIPLFPLPPSKITHTSQWWA